MEIKGQKTMRNLSILEGNDDPKYPKLELCFGGRRKFVGGSYVDFGKNFVWEITTIQRCSVE